MERLSDIRTVNSLRDYTEKIKEALAQASNQFIYIGFLLDEADRFEVYQQSGFDSIYDYCETIFGFKRSSTNNFIRVYRQFGEGIGLQEKFSRYSYSQLTEMCSMDRQQISQCAPEMSVRKIRELKQKPVYQQVICLDQKSDDSVQTSGQDEETMAVVFNNMWVDVPVSVYRAFWDAIPSFAKNNIRFGCHDIVVSYHKNT